MGRLGSINRQVNDLFLSSGIFTPGESKHSAKDFVRQNGIDDWHVMGKELTIYSYSTAEQYKDIWHQAANWTKGEFGVKDVSKISGSQVSAWLRHKIDNDGVSKNTVHQYAAALEKLGSAISRLTGATVSYSAELNTVRQYARTVLAKNQMERAYANPSKGFLVSGKGGFKRELSILPETQAKLLGHLAENDGKLCFDYNAYRQDLKAACQKAGEKYSGSHSFRHNYARESFTEHLANNKTYLEALKTVSAELGHHRASITKLYV